VKKKKEANNEPRIVKFRSPNTFLTKIKKVGGDGEEKKERKDKKTIKNKRNTKRNIKRVGLIFSFYFSAVVVVYVLFF